MQSSRCWFYLLLFFFFFFFLEPDNSAVRAYELCMRLYCTSIRANSVHLINY